MKAKYDKIGKGYNDTRTADGFLADRILSLLNPGTSGLYLDIGCGTGNYTDQFQQRGHQFIGMDPSQEMLTQARIKNNEVDWQLGSAEQTGLKTAGIDGVVGTLTTHHWSDLDQGFSELCRVLKPQGRVVIFTSTPAQMKGYWLNHYFPKMLAASMIQMPTLAATMDAMTNADMKVLLTEPYFVRRDLEDNFLYCGKERPELYLRADIRQGISSFSDLAIREEVQKGLLQIEEDIASNQIERVMESYQNSDGDYLFVLGQKVE